MNKLYTISILLILLSIASQAQQLKIGVKGGLSLVDVEVVSIPDGFDDVNRYRKVRPSYHVGAFGTVDLSEKFYFQAELLYANKGYRADYYEGSDPNIHLPYLTLPVLVNYKISEKLHGGLGGTLGYRLAAWSKSKTRRVDVSGRYDNKIEVGINVGLLYEISNKINFGARYTHGLSNIRREGEIIINGKPLAKEPKHQNRELQFSVGYVLGSGRLLDRSQNSGEDVADKKKSSTYLGFQVGMSNTTLEGSIIDGQITDHFGNKDGELKNRNGINLGFVLKHEFLSFIYIKTGLNYLQKGGKVVGSRYVHNVSAKLNYLNLPLVVGFQPINFRTTGNVNLGIEAGTSFNLLLGKDTKSLEAYYENRAAEYRPDEIENNDPIDIFWGANLEVKLNKKINLFLNYRQFKDIKEFYKVVYKFEDDGKEITNSADISSKGSVITTGLLFNVSKK